MKILYSIEDCDYDFVATAGANPSEDNSHHYLNATKLKPVAAADSTLVADIDDVVNALTDNSSAPIAGATGKISLLMVVKSKLDLTGEDGKLTIALSDLTGATGNYIAVTYEGTNHYKGTTGSASSLLVLKTVTLKIDPMVATQPYHCNQQ